MRKLKGRKDIVIQGVDKGGAVAIMEKGWYKKKKRTNCRRIQDYWEEYKEREGGTNK